MPSFRALFAVLLVLATAGAMPTAVNPADTHVVSSTMPMPSPPKDVRHEMVRNAMREAATHPNDHDSVITEEEELMPTEEQVHAIKECIGKPTLHRMKFCMRQAADHQEGAEDGGMCVAPDQLERVWHCVERHAMVDQNDPALESLPPPPHQQDHPAAAFIDPTLIPHRLYGKDKDASLSKPIVLVEDEGYSPLMPEQHLFKRKYGYGPDWLTAVGVRRAHPLP